MYVRQIKLEDKNNVSKKVKWNLYVHIMTMIFQVDTWIHLD